MIDYLIIIQARLESTRFPNKVMQTVGGVPMVKRVWDAAFIAQILLEIYFGKIAKIVVAWPERYHDLDQGDVLGRFKRLTLEFNPKNIIRLTADCPLLSEADIYKAVIQYQYKHLPNKHAYYSNHKDGHDVQIFTPEYLYAHGHKEHVIADFATQPTGLSVNTKQDLERVRKLCATK